MICGEIPMFRNGSILVAVFLSLQLVAGGVAAHGPTKVAQGIWGGDHLAVTVRDDGADLEFDCAVGQITGALTIDRKGEFRVQGLYRHDRPARMSADNPGNDQETQVIYTGRLKGTELEISVTLPGNEQPSVFRVFQGREAHLAKCM
jgi:hypothetical protein